MSINNWQSAGKAGVFRRRVSAVSCWFYGGLGRSRTADTRIFSSPESNNPASPDSENERFQALARGVAGRTPPPGPPTHPPRWKSAGKAYAHEALLDRLQANAVLMAAKLDPQLFLVRVATYAGVQFRRCAWCRAIVGVNDAAGGEPGITDGACDKCAGVFRSQLARLQGARSSC